MHLFHPQGTLGLRVILWLIADVCLMVFPVDSLRVSYKWKISFLPLHGQIVPHNISFHFGDVFTLSGDIVLDPLNEVLEIILVSFEACVDFDGYVVQIIIVWIEWSSLCP